MAVLQTQKIHICALKSSRKQILEELQRMGIVQIEESGEETPDFQKMDTAQARNRFEKRVKDAESALKTLDVYAPEKKGLLSSLEGQTPISTEQYYENVEGRTEILNQISRIHALEREIGERKADRERMEAEEVTMQPWMALDVPLSCRGTRSTSEILGTLPGLWTRSDILALVAEKHPEMDSYTMEVLSADKDQTCLYSVCPKEIETVLEDTLRENGFIRASFEIDQTPQEYTAKLQQKAAEDGNAVMTAISEIRELSKWREKIRFAADYYRMRADKYEVLGGILQTEHVFFLTGYVPANDSQALKERLENEYACEVEICDAEDSEKAPVLLKNNAFVAPTESVVESFGLPGKGEIDPTMIMAIFYYIFFGLMLSDAGYGILMVLGCGFVILRYRNMKKSTKKMITMFFWCGVTTTIWGILFGGFFGDVVTVYASTFLNRDITIHAVWLTPLEEPMKLLIYCFLFGLIQLFVGLGIKGYYSLRRKDYMDFFANVVCWYLLVIGLILVLLPTNIFTSMYGSKIAVPTPIVWLAVVMAVVGAVGILFFAESKRRNKGLRIAMGAYDLYGISSWLSDILSYSRLLALGLATGVIASVINTMAGMVGGIGGPVGFVLFWLVFVVGHALNMAINMLGAYVHTNRLQFVEFFGKFYEGGGRPFRPFSVSDNKYFKFKEEK